MANQHPTNNVGIISSGFHRSSGAYHGAIDFALPIGKPIYAVESGTVEAHNEGCPENGYINNPCGNYGGNWVRIKHSANFKTKSLHLAKVFVKTGEYVKRGQEIGLSGNSGSSTGPHLHFAVLINDVQVDPSSYINNQKPYPETDISQKKKCLWVCYLSLLCSFGGFTTTKESTLIQDWTISSI